MAGERTVQRSPDFDRITRLPERDATLALGEAASDLLTPMLVTPHGRRTGARLRPWQALFILEVTEAAPYTGGFLGLSVGGGKSLPCMLLPYTLQAKRPILILPGKLRDDTYTKFAEYGKDWVMPQPMPHLISFEEFQDDDNFDLLEQIMPDLILIDEVHKLKNQKRAVTKRIDRYQSMPEERMRHLCATRAAGPVQPFFPVVCSFSGSPFDQSIQDCSHFLVWGLNDQAPVPHNPAELAHWGDALNVRNPRVGQRPGVGVLTQLSKRVSAETKLLHARRAFGDRVRRTPRVIIADDTECDVPLTIQFEAAPDDEVLTVAFDDWRNGFKLPDGNVAGDIFNQLRWEDELGCGFFQKLTPPPPLEWREARWAVCDFIRARILDTERAKRPLDTEGAVLKAFKDHYIVQDWLAVEHLADHCVSVPTWISESVVLHAAQWIRRTHGLVSTLNPVFGRAVAAAAGVRYFGAQGEADDGLFIERERPGVGGVMSIKANGEGRNLQKIWHEMLMVGCERQANSVEQTIGRIHRYLQTKPVTITVLCTSGGTIANYRKAVSTANDFAAQITQHQNKILINPNPRVIYPSEALRWA